MAELDPRKETILRAIIIEYVGTAEPIGSEALLQRYELGVRSATIRNEMAEMSDLGYLEQPHTSAGRIPSDMGYRYYVDRLLEDRRVGETARQQVKQIASEGDALQELLRDTARILSRITRLLTVATTIRDHQVTVRNAVISALGPQQALLVLVLSNGHVENRMLECPTGLTLQDVGAANEFLVSTVAGRTLRGLARVKSPASGTSVASDKLLGLLCGTIRQACRDLTRGKVVTEGEEYMFGQPEFRGNASVLSELLERLSQTDFLYDALSADAPQTVTIGRENKEPLHQFSVVRRSFFVGPEEAGVLAVIGPTRMNYDESIPLVNFTAEVLSGGLTRYLGLQPPD
ncbi:MAG TPA: heat-inducible transcriptional repressor HrcA, partial [Fimbriimonadaceae bacterium]|nr:heat-inducible transcriptional repressor HrcA [Fimbriimonadaceae bacterium]